MSKNPQHTWNESNIVDDVYFQEKDAELFKNLIKSKQKQTTEEDSSLMIQEDPKRKNCRNYKRSCRCRCGPKI